MNRLLDRLSVRGPAVAGVVACLAAGLWVVTGYRSWVAVAGFVPVIAVRVYLARRLRTQIGVTAVRELVSR